jgi:S1-C subfamily serine protease
MKLSKACILIILSLLLLGSCATGSPDKIEYKLIQSHPVDLDKPFLFYPNPFDSFNATEIVCNVFKEYGLDAHIPRITSSDSKSTQTMLGTGFFIGDEKVVTNSHVVGGAENVAVISNGTRYEGVVILDDPSNDLAFIQLFPPLPNFPHFKVVPSSDFEVAESILVLGYPLSDILGNDIRVTNGIVNSKSGLIGRTSSIQISAAIQPGSSGSPVVNDDFEVIGIASSTLSAEYMANIKSAIPQAVNFAVSSDPILEKMGLLSIESSGPQVSNITEAIQASVQVISQPKPIEASPQSINIVMVSTIRVHESQPMLIEITITTFDDTNHYTAAEVVWVGYVTPNTWEAIVRKHATDLVELIRNTASHQVPYTAL